MAFQLDIQNLTFMVPEDGDPCALWVGYYHQLEKAFGKTRAKMLWLVSWKANGSLRCTTNTRFISWMQKHEIDVSTAATRALADASAMGSNFMGLGKNMSKLLGTGVPIVLGITLIILIRVLWNTSKNVDLHAITALAPQGRGVSIAKKLLQK